MKITFLLFNADGMGGTSRSAITQANALADPAVGGHDVTIVSVTRSGLGPHHTLDPTLTLTYLVDVVDPEAPRLEQGGDLSPEECLNLSQLQSRYIPRRWDKHFSRLLDVALQSHLPTIEADVVVTTTPELLAVAVQLLPPGPAVVHQEHRSTSQRGADLDPLLVFAPRADIVAALTDWNAAWLARALGPLRPEIISMPNPLPRGFAPRSRLDNPLIVAAGRLVPEKQYPQLLQAFALIADEIPEWRVRIYGAGQRRNQLMALARSLGLFDRVELPGSTDDMAAEWAKASISALTSRSEGFPLVVQEAMAAGVPVVSYDCPTGPRAIIDHGVNGLLVEPDSTTGLADALLRLASDPELRRSMGAAAHHSAQQYDATRIAHRWESVFARAIELRRGHATAAAPPELADLQLAPHAADEHPTPAQARTAALTWAVLAAERSTTEWLVIPPHRDEPAVVVVPGDRREAYLHALGEAGAPSYLSLRDPGLHDWDERRGTLAELSQDLLRGVTSVVVLEPWPRDVTGPSVLAQGCSVEVQFWQVDRAGDWIAPVANRYCNTVSISAATLHQVEVHGLLVPTLPEMKLPTADECAFPIDVVYTWVDGTDQAWNERREERLRQLTGGAQRRESSGLARFLSRDELRYSMRSLHLFAPWVRTIHVVTAGQHPVWLDTDHPQIRLVDHADIFPADALPTFNSHAIETRLHHVPDLSEHFIYVNDDVMLGRPLRPEMFFTPSGLAAAFPAEHIVGLPGQQRAPYLLAAQNNRRLLAETFGVYTTHTMSHTPHPHLRSVLQEIEERFADAVSTTTRSAFRADTDVSLLSSLAQHYGLLTGQAYVATAEQAYVNVGIGGLARNLAVLGARDRDFICFADHHDHALSDHEINAALADFFESYFPIAAPWEKT